MSQSGAFSAKGPAPANNFTGAVAGNAGINIYNVNGTANSSIIDPGRATQYNNPMAMAQSDQVTTAGFNNTFYNQNKAT